MTGRKGRVVQQANGNVEYESRAGVGATLETLNLIGTYLILRLSAPWFRSTLVILERIFRFLMFQKNKSSWTTKKMLS